MAKTKPFDKTSVLEESIVQEAIARAIFEVKDAQITYYLNQKKTYNWNDPEEWVRAWVIAFLTIVKGYPANRMKTEVTVPRRTPSDHADLVVYRDDKCKEPYLTVECKPFGQSKTEREQAIEQLFGNANSLRCPLGLYDEVSHSAFYDVASFEPTERKENLKGTRDALPPLYGEIPKYTYIADGDTDIVAVKPSVLESKIRKAHSLIWSGGRRDPLRAFDEWSKLLFAKVHDERETESGQPRRFQVGTNETTASVANRVHELFGSAEKTDASIFPEGTRIDLPDRKVFDVVRTLQDVSFTRTDVDSIGIAFENFFGSVFRGELGQYFTMRQLARFTVSMINVNKDDFIIDPTAGSGGFLLEALLQVWHAIDRNLPQDQRERVKLDFALKKVYGIEIHETLARICKINLLLHHDGHTNIEGDRSCLDSTFSLPRLNPPRRKFTVVVGNPPFGDDVEEGDEDHLGLNHLSAFTVAEGRTKVPSEHVIIERGIELLQAGGRLGFVLPDGVFNNQGEPSNCPRLRRFLAKSGRIAAIVSLPDYAFRKSGAQNKTSIIIFRKFTNDERQEFDAAFDAALNDLGEVDPKEVDPKTEDEVVLRALKTNDYRVFLAEANHIGYTTTGMPSEINDLFRGRSGGVIDTNQEGTILGEYRRFVGDPEHYNSSTQPDCVAISMSEMWESHESHRLDPKYFIFKLEGKLTPPQGWISVPLSKVMKRREEIVTPEAEPDKDFKVMTISQTGVIRRREAGKGNNPPDWRGAYFEDSPSTWFAAHAGDVVFSSIDLWKGCIAVVPKEFDGALVTKEFPIYEITDDRLDADFLSILLRSRYYQRAFRAITTGHSNRRRTQEADFENLEISFPPDPEQQRKLISEIVESRNRQSASAANAQRALLKFSNMLDHRGDEELPEINAAPVEAEEEA